MQATQQASAQHFTELADTPNTKFVDLEGKLHTVITKGKAFHYHFQAKVY